MPAYIVNADICSWSDVMRHSCASEVLLHIGRRVFEAGVIHR